MKKRISIFGLLAMMAYGALAQGLNPVSPHIDCGEMSYMNPFTYLVQFQNTGKESVEIKKVDTGCGCTVADYPKGVIRPNESAQIGLTFDCKSLGHFQRAVRVFYTTGRETEPSYSEVTVKGVVLANKVGYSGNYPYKMGTLSTDNDYIEFDDVNQGQKFMQEIHIQNNSSQSAYPVLLRVPAYITAEMIPECLAPKQVGVMRITLNSSKLRDYGLNQTTVFLGKNSSDNVTKDKAITISAVLLPPAISKDDVSRPFSPKISLSKDFIDMTPLKEKNKHKDDIIITNNGKKPLEIQKLQLFTTGLEITLDKQTIAPGETGKLAVMCKSKDLKKLRVRPRILMITNDPDHQKVVIEVKE